MPNGGLYGEHLDIPLTEQIQNLINSKRRLEKQVKEQCEMIKKLEEENKSLKLVISLKKNEE